MKRLCALGGNHPSIDAHLQAALSASPPAAHACRLAASTEGAAHVLGRELPALHARMHLLLARTQALNEQLQQAKELQQSRQPAAAAGHLTSS